MQSLDRGSSSEDLSHHGVNCQAKERSSFFRLAPVVSGFCWSTQLRFLALRQDRCGKVGTGQPLFSVPDLLGAGAVPKTHSLLVSSCQWRPGGARAGDQDCGLPCISKPSRRASFCAHNSNNSTKRAQKEAPPLLDSTGSAEISWFQASGAQGSQSIRVPGLHGFPALYRIGNFS